MNVICLSHPQYDGSQPPVLSCKNCCGIFIAEIKRRAQSEENQFNAYQWLEDKAREVKSHPRQPNSGVNASATQK